MSLISAALGIANALGVTDTVSSWFGGNNGNEIADKVLKVTQAITGTTSLSSTIEAIQDPVMAAKVEEALMQHELEFNKLAFGDKKDARELQEKTLDGGDKFAKRFIYYFAFYWAIFASIYLLAITFCNIPEQSVRFADTILGFLLGTIIGGIISFFYGASFKEPKAKLNTKPI